MMKRSRLYPRPTVVSGSVSAVGQAGGVLLTETIRAAGLDVGLSVGLSRWRRPGAVHDPAKVVLDLAVTLALGGDCLADVAVLRAEAGLYGSVASDPTVSRTIAALAADVPAALAAIDTARAAARSRVWAAAGRDAPDHDTSAAVPLVIDLDATLVTSHSTGIGPDVQARLRVSPCARSSTTARPAPGRWSPALRPGNAGSNTATDHIAVPRAALAQLPAHRTGRRPGRKVLIRTDGAGSSHAFLDWLTNQRLSYSVGFALPNTTGELLALMEEQVWTPAYNSDGQVREGAWVAELTGMLTLTGWPKGMRVIARKERPHPGAQLRITDPDGLRVTAFATNTVRGQLPALELRHRRRARAEDRIRCAKDIRAAEPAAARSGPEPHLVRHRHPRRGDHRLDATPGPDQHERPPLGTQEAAPAVVHHRRRPHPPQPGHGADPESETPLAALAHEAVTALRALPAPG